MNKSADSDAKLMAHLYMWLPLPGLQWSEVERGVGYLLLSQQQGARRVQLVIQHLGLAKQAPAVGRWGPGGNSPQDAACTLTDHAHCG
jgi:hypothetical protein